MSDELLSESIQLQILFAKSEDEEIKAYEKLILEQKIENIVLQNIKTNDKRIQMLKRYNKAKKSYDEPIMIVTQSEAEEAEKNFSNVLPIAFGLLYISTTAIIAFVSPCCDCCNNI